MTVPGWRDEDATEPKPTEACSCGATASRAVEEVRIAAASDRHPQPKPHTDRAEIALPRRQT